MARQNIGVGSFPDDGTGDTLRDAFIKVNDNFVELYDNDAADTLDAVTTLGNTTTNSITVGGLIVDTDTIYVDSANNQVGIGTTSPNEGNLQVGDSDTNTIIAIAGNRTKIAYDSSNTILFSAENIGMKFYTGHNTFANPGNERLRITSGGDISFFDTSENEALYWDASAASLGIGTDSPDTALNVRGDLLVEDSEGIRYVRIDAPDAGNSYVGRIGTTSSHDLALLSANTERMRIDSSGNVGIGTASPQGKLHVYNPSGTSGLWITRSDNTSGVGLHLQTDSSKTRINSYGDLTFWTAATGATSTEKVRIDSSGVTSLYDDLVLDNSSPEIYFETSASHYRWMLAAQENVDGAFEITPSTTVGGTTYSSPVAVFKATGNVGIGTTSPATTLEASQVGTGNTDGQVLAETQGANGNAGYGFRTNGTTRWNISTIGTDGSNNLRFYDVNNSAERMRITSTGRVLFSGLTTTEAGVALNGIEASCDQANSFTAAFNQQNTGAYATLGISAAHSSGTNKFIWFYVNDYNGGGVGSISTTGTSTAYNTTSDYRLKENVVDMTGALDRVDQLEPRRFNFIADANKTVDGFLAHEVADIVPEAVTGTHNEVDDEGNPVYQGIDQSKLVPLLVGAIQEQQEIINDLKARIETLENA